MPKSGFDKQICACGEPARVSVRIFARSLRITPRITTDSITIYVCPKCAARGLRPASRELVLDGVNSAAKAIGDEVIRLDPEVPVP